MGRLGHKVCLCAVCLSDQNADIFEVWMNICESYAVISRSGAQLTFDVVQCGLMRSDMGAMWYLVKPIPMAFILEVMTYFLFENCVV